MGKKRILVIAGSDSSGGALVNSLHLIHIAIQLTDILGDWKPTKKSLLLIYATL